MYLETNKTHFGDSLKLLPRVEPESIALSVWSPPYHVGKQYEKELTYAQWAALLKKVIRLHYPLLKPGGFLAINCADILCFPDKTIPKFQASNHHRRTHNLSHEEVLTLRNQYPALSLHQLSSILGVSEQTVSRRLYGNNSGGGKYGPQTRVHLVGGLLDEFAYKAGLYLYDRRIWAKDPAWENSKWHCLSYRAVDEFEYIYIFWKPGVTNIDRSKLSKSEWAEWGSRAIWKIPSVRANRIHEAMFPVALPNRLIRLLTAEGDTILDCFMGSGASALAAIQTNRKYIGIEVVKQYADMANLQSKTELEKRQTPTTGIRKSGKILKSIELYRLLENT